jgi:hypothetical protein
MKKREELGREAPMVINPLRLARLVRDVARQVLAGRRKRPVR